MNMMNQNFTFFQKKSNLNRKLIAILTRIAPELITVQFNPDAAYWNTIDEMDAAELSLYSYPHRVFGSGLRNSAHMLLVIVLDKI